MKNENEKDLAREKLFKKIYDIMLEKDAEQSYAGIELSQFLANYAYHILTNKEIFDERFFNDVLDHCMLGKKSLKQLRFLCKSVRTIVRKFLISFHFKFFFFLIKRICNSFFFSFSELS